MTNCQAVGLILVQMRILCPRFHMQLSEMRGKNPAGFKDGSRGSRPKADTPG